MIFFGDFTVRMEAGWRTLFSVCLAAVLVMGSVSNDCTPTISMQDLGRATVAAAGVFEGRLLMLGDQPASSSSPFADGQLNATFSFNRWLKGKFRRMNAVRVRLSSTGDTRVTRTDSTASCSVSDLLVLRHNYIIFVDKAQRADIANERSGFVSLQSTAFPVSSTKDTVRQIEAYRCRKCG